MFQTEEAKYAWLAGIVDSEGSITFQSKWIPRLGIYSSTPKFLEKIKLELGWDDVKIYKNRVKGGYGVHIEYMLIVKGKRLRMLLPKIQPFLIVKQEQAKIAVELSNLTCRENWRGNWKNGSSAYREKCMELSQGIRYLNRRGQSLEVKVGEKP